MFSGEEAGGAHGPLRASAHIRVSARFDHQPDICKDYKSGWQLEKKWDEAERVRKWNLALGIDDEDEWTAEKSDEDEDDSLPFACFICSIMLETRSVSCAVSQPWGYSTLHLRYAEKVS
ncbi:zinc finger CCCH domain-containing protein 1-like [Coffea eugenioides]|uniref:zinc finger CCCH domain-containing protein 1-like n=1 Tax=Coffea eugenioides TaxID=49369 RepID=UPI000F5D1BFC|nr:zinc finger CCCH domain-containing protein 1-like isoform X1 [Coffea arabica]XP_027162277.1 zinc finger CCCH domain-containing protein 1-like [Coffea eugenioides]